MIIVITAGPDGSPALGVEQPDELTSFHVEARSVDRHSVAVALAKAGAGTVVGDDAFIEPAAIERLAIADGIGEDWPTRFLAMQRYAGDHGWVDAAGAIQAHIDWR